jgi:hypothetical protein
MNNHRDHLRAMLEEDTGSRDEARALLPVIQQLRDLNTPTGDPQALIAALLLHLPESRRARWQRKFAEWWLLLRSQLRVMRSEIWIASLLVILFGTVVTLTESQSGTYDNNLPLVIVAPLVTAVGIAFIYGPDVDPILEIQLATPVSPRLILLARLAAIFGFDLALSLIGSVVLVAFGASDALWPLILAWLAPMAFLSALAFFLAVFSQETILSALACFVLWIWQSIDIEYISIPDLTSAAARPYLLVMAMLLGGIALWLAGRDERWVSG